MPQTSPSAAPSQGQQEEQGFFGRLGSMMFKLMLAQTVMGMISNMFAPKQEVIQGSPLGSGGDITFQNALTPNSDFDVFMHFMYVRNETVLTSDDKPGVASPSASTGSSPSEAEASSSSGILASIKAQLGVPQASVFPAPLQVWGVYPLKNLIERKHDETLPPPDASWTLLGQKYAYSWRSSSEKKQLTFRLDDRFLNSEDYVLLLTVSAVPFDAYGESRAEMTSEEDVLKAAAAVPQDRVIQRSVSLVKVMKPFLESDAESHSLLFDSGAAEQKAKEEPFFQVGACMQEQKLIPIRHLKLHTDVSLVFDSTRHSYATLNAGPLQSLRLKFETGEYEPMLHLSDFWLVEKHFLPLNDTLSGSDVTLSLSFGVGSVYAWILQEQMTGALNHQQQMGLQSDREAFMFKRILVDTNPFMLAFSAAFILLHSLFSFFAFKNEMQFWYKNESMEGLSAGSLLFGFVCELVIGLYLFDSGETSWLILFEVFVGVAIAGWKVSKAIRLRPRPKFPFVGVEFVQSYVKSSTHDYDSVAIKYTSIALTPCVVGYAVYALLHNKYRSWYSYILSVLAGSVYTFVRLERRGLRDAGFVMMTPQLYINYKLKSVAHLPWRALIYRFLNTFVDDVASFLVDMPWLHRLSCFRDDIIFIAYLYQRWIYRVDTRRTHEEEVPLAPEIDSTASTEMQPLAKGATRRGPANSAGKQQRSSDSASNPPPAEGGKKSI